MQNKETKERNLYSDLQRRMLGKDVKQRMENKMQDSKRDISQILVDFGIYNQSGIASMRLDKELREYFATEISKAREEGKLYALDNLREDIEMLLEREREIRNNVRFSFILGLIMIVVLLVSSLLN